MESPLKKYKQFLRIDGIREIAYNTIFTKYIESNLKADKKKWEIDSTEKNRKLEEWKTWIHEAKECDSDIKIYIDGKAFDQQDFTYINKISQIIEASGQPFSNFELGNLKISTQGMTTYTEDLIKL